MSQQQIVARAKELEGKSVGDQSSLASPDSGARFAQTPAKAGLGFVVTRAWLFFNYFFWGGAFAATVGAYCSAPERWQRRDFWEIAGFLFPLLATLPYLLFIYARSLRKAWCINAKRDIAPDFSAKELEQIAELLPKVGAGDDEPCASTGTGPGHRFAVANRRPHPVSLESGVGPH